MSNHACLSMPAATIGKIGAFSVSGGYSAVGNIFGRSDMDLSAFKFSWRAPKRHLFEVEWLMAIRGHLRSLISIATESAHATSYWSSVVFV